jgi:hypothetical protein
MVFAHNIARGVLAILILYAAILVTLGGGIAALFAAQSIIGIFVLELFNHIAHYGLSRRPFGKGWSAPPTAGIRATCLPAH